MRLRFSQTLLVMILNGSRIILEYFEFSCFTSILDFETQLYLKIGGKEKKKRVYYGHLTVLNWIYIYIPYHRRS